MADTKVQEGYEFNPKREMPRTYDPDYNSKAGRRNTRRADIFSDEPTRHEKYSAGRAAQAKIIRDEGTAEDAELRHSHGVTDINKAPNIRDLTDSSFTVNNYLINPRSKKTGWGESTDDVLARNRSAKERAHLASLEIKTHAKPLDRELHVYSGTGEQWKGTSSLKEGDVLHTPAFTSTTIRPSVATRRAGSRYDRAREARAGRSSESLKQDGIAVERDVLHFHLPVGYKKGLHVSGISHFEHEHEYLLDKGQKWKVQAITHHTSEVLHTHANVVSPDGVTDHDYVPVKSRNRARFITLVPHMEEKKSRTENIQEVLIPHSEKNAEAVLSGKSIRHKIDAKLTSMFITPHPKVDSPEAVKSLSSYTVSSTAMNNALIAKDHRFLNGHGSYSDVPEKYRHIKEAFNTVEPLKHEHHLYSGVGQWNPTGRKTNLIGALIHTPAFTSTSHDMDIAHRFATKGTIIHFHLPVGYDRAMNMRNFSKSKFEHEVLLDHGQTWKIHNVQTVPGPHMPIRVITVKPHTENIQEVFKHREAAMKGMLADGTKMSTWHDAKVHTDAVEKQVQANHKDADKHAEHLTEHNLIGPETPEHKQTLMQYTLNSTPINGHLLKQHGLKIAKSSPDGKRSSPKKIDAHIANLDSMLDAAKPLKKAGNFYSGTHKWNPTRGLSVGDVVHTPAYTSASVNVTGTDEFLSSDKTNNKHIIHFQLPKGYRKGAYVGHLTSIGTDEQEFLLHRNQKWVYKGSEAHSSYNGWANKNYVTNIHTFVPHEETIQEAFEHNPRTDIDRRVKFDNMNPTWKAKHDKLTSQLSADHNGRIEEEHHHLTDLHGAFHSAPLKNEYSEGSSHIAYHLVDPSMTHEEDAQYLDKSINKISDEIKRTSVPLDRKHHVYSGVSRHIDSKIGDVVHMPAFTSTSIDINQARQFSSAGFGSGNKERNILHFHLPAGYNRGTYLGEHASYHPNEKEYLLDKDQKWKVHHIQHVHNLISGGLGDSGVKHFKYRIITLKPHVENVNEARYHSTFAFRDRSHFKPDPVLGYTRPTHTPTNQMYNATAQHAGTFLNHDIIQHHYELSNQFRHIGEKDSKTTLARMDIRDYTSSMAQSEGINTAAVKKANGEEGHLGYTNRADKLEHALNHVARPLKNEAHVYSGLKWDPKVEIGDSFTTPAFTSTSINPHTSMSYTDPKHESYTTPDRDTFRKTTNSHQHVIHFHLPAGYNRGAYIANVSSYDGEQEFLLNRGQKWRVKNKKTYTKAMNIDTGDRHEGKSERNTRTTVWTVEPHDK